MTGPLTTQEKLEALGRMLAEDPATASRLTSVTDPSDVPDTISRLAQAHGIPLTPAEVSDALAKMKAQQGAVRDLDDDELAAVAGGKLSDCVLNSLVMGVIGCIIISLVSNARKGDCAKDLNFDH